MCLVQLKPEEFKNGFKMVSLFKNLYICVLFQSYFSKNNQNGPLIGVFNGFVHVNEIKRINMVS